LRQTKQKSRARRWDVSVRPRDIEEGGEPGEFLIARNTDVGEEMGLCARWGRVGGSMSISVRTRTGSRSKILGKG